MFGADNHKQALLIIDTDPGGTDEIFYLMKAPEKLTILNVYAVGEQTQNAGTAIQARLENWGTAGTAVEGTICPYIGGTTAVSGTVTTGNGGRLTGRTPATGVIDTTQQYLDAGDWLVARYGELGAGWIANDRLQVVVEYVIGVGN